MDFDFEDFYAPDYDDYMDVVITTRWRGGMNVDDFIDSFSVEELDGISQYLTAVHSPIEPSKGNLSWLIVDYLQDWIICAIKDGVNDVEELAHILKCVSLVLTERELMA